MSRVNLVRELNKTARAGPNWAKLAWYPPYIGIRSRVYESLNSKINFFVRNKNKSHDTIVLASSSIQTHALSVMQISSQNGHSPYKAGHSWSMQATRPVLACEPKPVKYYIFQEFAKIHLANIVIWQLAKIYDKWINRLSLKVCHLNLVLVK
jgi:hypothetical protein